MFRMQHEMRMPFASPINILTSMLMFNYTL